MTTQALLDIQNLRKEFPGVVALDDVSLQILPGEVHALMGENGAGKSTLIKTLTGVYARDGGAVHLDGTLIHPHSSRDAQDLGISTVYQEVNLLPNLSVAQNIFLGREPRRFGLIDWGAVNRDAEKLLERFDLKLDVTAALETYSVAQQQLVAIARAQAFDAKLLILDEPTASLDSHEVDVLFDVMRELKAQGMGIIFVSHFLDQIYAISDRISVLRNGRYVLSAAVAELPKPALIEAMLGKSMDDSVLTSRHEPQTSQPEPLLQAVDIQVDKKLQRASLAVGKGEVLGLAGLLGSGRSEVCRALFGIDPLAGGSITMAGETLQAKRPADCIEREIALCPEDRKKEGIVGELSLRENIILALQVRRGWWKKLSREEQCRIAEAAVSDLNIVTTGIEKPIGELSGGNQQKAILARWIAVAPRLLILDEPTRGVDVGAHSEILKLIRRLCDEGLALLVTSSELDEIVAFSHRVAIMRDRQLVAELDGEAISSESIMKAIAGAA